MTTFNPLAAIYAPQGQHVLFPVTGTSVSLSATSSAPTPTVFISRLPPTYDETQLLALGSPYGHVKSARYVMRPGEGKSFGFLLYGSIVEAQHAILGLMDSGYKVGFARETLKEKMERLSDPFETNVYVKNLPADFSAQAIERLFAPSIIVSAKILETGRGGVPGKGVALVRLQTRDEAHSAVDALHGRLIPGSAAPLVVRFADNLAQKAVREEAAQSKKRSSSSIAHASPFPDGSESPESWTSSPLLATPQTPTGSVFSAAPTSTYTSDLHTPFFNPYLVAGLASQAQAQQQQQQGSYLAAAYANQGYHPIHLPYGIGGGGSPASSAASSATSSTFGPGVGLGLMYPGGGGSGGGQQFQKRMTVGEEEQWGRVRW